MSDAALFRLIGDGDRAAGGAIPLPVAFTAVTGELLDHDSADTARLTRLVSDVLAFKEERIMAAAWRSWSQFTADILDILASMNLIRETSPGKWERTEELVSEGEYKLPGTEIGFTPRNREARTIREHNERAYLQLQRDLAVVTDGIARVLPEVPEMNSLAKVQLEQGVRLLAEARTVLERELKLNMPPVTRYRKEHPRKPHQLGKRLHKGMAAFFRDEFWFKYAEDGVIYDIADVGRKFTELHPEHPLGHNDLLGSMRKAARDMVDAGILETDRVLGNGALKNVYWKKGTRRNPPPGYGANAAVVTWEGLRGDPKG